LPLLSQEKNERIFQYPTQRLFAICSKCLCARKKIIVDFDRGFHNLED